jgi:hypothetical protein
LKAIVVNANAQYAKSFMNGIKDTTCEIMNTRESILHIYQGTDVRFIQRNETVDFTDSFVYLSSTFKDRHFGSLLCKYLISKDILFNDKCNAEHSGMINKTSQVVVLACGGVKVPETFIFNNISYPENKDYIVDNLSFPAVFKTDGANGTNVFLVNNIQELELQLSAHRKEVLCNVQPFIPNEYDIRIICQFGEVMGAIKRIRLEGFKNNVAQGSRVEAHEMTELQTQIALKAFEVLDTDYGGLDMIVGPDGPVVVELNINCGTTGFNSVHTDDKVHGRLAKRMRDIYLIKKQMQG